jgi:hypothetical protein
MDCRKFHRNLEDYLQGGLDFSGRFRMERHAQQCISCGKEMADAQQLRRMMHELKQVRAPSNLESSILNEIGMRKGRSRFSNIRDFWIYGFEWPSWRKMILASSGLAILGLGIFYASRQATLDPASTLPPVAAKPANEEEEIAKPTNTIAMIDAEEESGTKADLSFSEQPAAPEAPKAARAAQPSSFSEQEIVVDPEFGDLEYVEYQVMGPDNRPLTIRLPKYRQSSEEYFIRNVSH